jgi:hypothetical protein
MAQRHSRAARAHGRDHEVFVARAPRGRNSRSARCHLGSRHGASLDTELATVIASF